MAKINSVRKKQTQWIIYCTKDLATDKSSQLAKEGIYISYHESFGKGVSLYEGSTLPKENHLTLLQTFSTIGECGIVDLDTASELECGELSTHLHTSVCLTGRVVALLPANCQLWHHLHCRHRYTQIAFTEFVCYVESKTEMKS